MLVKLSDTQAATLHESLGGEISDEFADLIMQSLYNISQQLKASKRQAWDDVAQIAGFKDIHDARKSGKNIRINWATQELTVEDLDTRKLKITEKLLSGEYDEDVAEDIKYLLEH